MPQPSYPESAPRFRLGGRGWFELSIDFASGRVQQVKVLESTGIPILDAAAIKAFREWRAKPGVLHRAVIPVTFMPRYIPHYATPRLP
jgi:TonB family protein